MLFKEFLLEGRPFYDEQGNKYVASKNDHYSKNGEEISKQEYDRVVHELKTSTKQNKNIAQPKMFNKETDDGIEFLQAKFPKMNIQFSGINKKLINLITENVNEIVIKYPKLQEFISESFFGDDNKALTKKIKENDKNVLEYYKKLNTGTKELLDKKSMEFINWFEEQAKTKNEFYSFQNIFKNHLDKKEQQQFLKRNNLNPNELFSKDKIDEQSLQQLLIGVIKSKLSFSGSLPKTSLGEGAYYLGKNEKYNLPYQRGIILNKDVFENNGVLYPLEEPDNYDDFHLDIKGDHKTYKEIVTHEIGHMIDHMLDLSNNPEIIKLFDENKQKIKTEVSRYASKSISEFIPECFAEYFLSGNPRELPQKVGEIIDKLMKY